jgi:hypothetical protein
MSTSQGREHPLRWNHEHQIANLRGITKCKTESLPHGLLLGKANLETGRLSSFCIDRKRLALYY